VVHRVRERVAAVEAGGRGVGDRGRVAARQAERARVIRDRSGRPVPRRRDDREGELAVVQVGAAERDVHRGVLIGRCRRAGGARRRGVRQRRRGGGGGGRGGGGGGGRGGAGGGGRGERRDRGGGDVRRGGGGGDGTGV